MLPVFSPILIYLAVIACVFLVAIYALDRQQTKHTKHTESLMRAFVLQHAMKSFTVVSECSHNSADIKDLIRHLEATHYERLQLLVLLDNDVPATTVRELRKLQRNRREHLTISVARYKTAAARRAATLRYANGEVLLWLRSDERISQNFFERLSVELLDESVNAITPCNAPAVNDSVRSASSALDSVALSMFSMLKRNQSTNPRVMTKSAYKSGKITNTINSNRASVIIPRTAVRWVTIIPAMMVLFIPACVAIVSALNLPTGWQLITGTTYISLLLLVGVLLITYPYRVLIKLSLLLLLPLWPIVSVLLHCIRPLHTFIRLIKVRLLLRRAAKNQISSYKA